MSPERMENESSAAEISIEEKIRNLEGHINRRQKFIAERREEIAQLKAEGVVTNKEEIAAIQEVITDFEKLNDEDAHAIEKLKAGESA